MLVTHCEVDPQICFTNMLQETSEVCLRTCNKVNYGRDWKELGAVLFLETAEFIEAIRGKGTDTPAMEAAHIIFALLAGCSHHKVSMTEVVKELENHITKLKGVANAENTTTT